MGEETDETTPNGDFGDPSPNTLRNAGLGAVVAVAFAFVPLSTVIGGIFAGYVQDESPRSGVKVGALTGAFAAVPFAIAAVFIWSAIAGAGTGSVTSTLTAVFVPVATGLLVYTVAFAAVGGLLGNLLHEALEGRG